MTDFTTQNKSGWVKVAFGDVVKLARERSNNRELDGFNRVVGLEHLDPGELKISRWANIADGTTFTNVFRSGQVLFGKRRAYQRKVALASFEGVCSGDIYVLESSSPQLMPELLPYICQSDAFFDHAVGTSAGSLSPRTNWTSLANFEFMLPPLQEQARIVEVLGAADKAQQKLGELLVKADKFHTALVRELLNIDRNGSPRGESSPGSGGFYQPLGKTVNFLDGSRVPLKSADRSKMQGEFPYYGASGIIDYIDRYIFDEDLVLLSEDGANLTDRSSPIAFEAQGKYWVNNHAHVLKVKNPLSNFFLIQYLQAISLVPWITGTAQPKLNKAYAEQIPVFFPADIEDAENRIQTSHRAVVKCRERIHNLTRIKSTLLDKII